MQDLPCSTIRDMMADTPFRLAVFQHTSRCPSCALIWSRQQNTHAAFDSWRSQAGNTTPPQLDRALRRIPDDVAMSDPRRRPPPSPSSARDKSSLRDDLTALAMAARKREIAAQGWFPRSKEGASLDRRAQESLGAAGLRLLLAHRELIDFAAGRRSPDILGHEQAVRICERALIEAAEAVRPPRVDFEPFADWRMWRALLLEERIIRLRKAARVLWTRLDRLPSVEELAAEADMSRKHIDLLLRWWRDREQRDAPGDPLPHLIRNLLPPREQNAKIYLSRREKVLLLRVLEQQTEDEASLERQASEQDTTPERLSRVLEKSIRSVLWQLQHD